MGNEQLAANFFVRGRYGHRRCARVINGAMSNHWYIKQIQNENISKNNTVLYIYSELRPTNPKIKKKKKKKKKKTLR
eukprot:NODE_7798_length_266_cov_272.751152_g6638_i0.p1 GENE.NODE_7798_length_266_cov_272.751152_g6638_i0~~NODE_7798_length_266_cov_272.751152_g6638_i0.p1  ORF type:complete len:77 (-),score=25.47 NODE_7798_length_266_cov_272.751152_g6638_i0:3-233(-)